jgi:hypothetical protein
MRLYLLFVQSFCEECMESKEYLIDELQGLSATLSNMLKKRHVFENSWKDFTVANPWSRDILAALAMPAHLNDLFYNEHISTGSMSSKRALNDTSAAHVSLQPCAEWDKALLQSNRREKFGKIVTVRLQLSQKCYSELCWGFHIPNRFHFAEVTPGSFQYLGFHYPR